MSELEVPVAQPAPRSGRTWARLSLLAVLLGGLFVIGQSSGYFDDLSPERVRELLLAAGICGVAWFFIGFAVGNLLQIPGMLFVAAAILAYGKILGTGIALVGALVAVSVSFWVVRAVGGKALNLVQRPRMRKILDQLEGKPVRTVILLRTFTQMSPPVNAALALSNIRYRDYLLGSILGLVLPIGAAALALELILANLG